MDISNKTLALFLVLAVVISVGGTLVSLYKLNTLSGPSTGYATVNSTGIVLLNVSLTSSIRFDVNTVNFGTGYVNSSVAQNCTMTINETSTITHSWDGCEGFATTNAGGSFVIENNGNTYLNVTLNSSGNVSDFIGGTESARKFSYIINNNESTSCGGTLYSTTWTNVAKTDTVICNNLSYADNSDSLRIGIQVIIPYDAPMGSHTDTFTATGTSLP